jgi:hypothetical protein
MTQSGGDLFAWSSNGDLDAGRGSRTIFSANRLLVNFDNNNYQTTDRRASVTGSGLATITPPLDVQEDNERNGKPRKGTLSLFAPNGRIDAGDAGIRADTLIISAPVVLNADNIKVSGAASGLSSAPPSLPASLGVPTNPTPTNTNVDTSPTGTANSSQASIVIVEVVGYGGGDGPADTPTGQIPQSGQEQNPPEQNGPAQRRPNSERESSEEDQRTQSQP